MLYWYAARGDTSSRGLADDIVLFEMARKGNLKPTDLVWSASGGTRWVPASTVDSLLPAWEAAAAQQRKAEAQVVGIGRRRWITAAVAAALILCVAALAVYWRMGNPRRHAGDTDFLKPLERAAMASTNSSAYTRRAAIASARSNAVEALRDRIAVCFDNDRLDEAEKLIADLKLHVGGAEHASRLSTRLDVLRLAVAHRTKLETALRGGTIDRAGADELLQMYLAGVPSDKTVWVELAAVLCAKGDHDGAMKALRQGVERAGDEARASARRDARFDPLRETQDFKTLAGAE